MATATLTLIGMYNYDDSLFENMSLPSGISSTMTRSAILARSGEFEVLYPDLDFMKQMIGFVASKWNRTFQKWYDALQLSYDPIYNYDRFEEWTDNGTDTGTVKNDGSNTGTVTDSGSNTGTVKTEQDTSSNENSSGNGQTDTFVNAYNNNALVEDGQSKSTQSASATTTGNNDTTETRNLASGNTRTDNLQNSNMETRNLASSGKHSGHMYGNIGVTTSQQMLQSELDIAEWNLYEHIADVFVRELCIPVYG